MKLIQTFIVTLLILSLVFLLCFLINQENTFLHVKYSNDELNAQAMPFDSSNVQDNSIIIVAVKNRSFNMVKVKADSFVMGCTSKYGQDCYGNEKPSHRVMITNDFYIGENEVTQELYEIVMDTNPSYYKSPNNPVENVSWNDAQEFCKKLSQITGRHFCLPTEAEWEYAARGGKKTKDVKYSGSSNVSDVAWFAANSKGRTHPVGKLSPNELGIYDMSGNVWEWCQDCYESYHKTKSVDPKVHKTNACRVLRGGCWCSSERNCRITMRSCNYPDYRYRVFGFRVALH